MQSCVWDQSRVLKSLGIIRMRLLRKSGDNVIRILKTRSESTRCIFVSTESTPPRFPKWSTKFRYSRLDVCCKSKLTLVGRYTINSPLIIRSFACIFADSRRGDSVCVHHYTLVIESDFLMEQQSTTNSGCLV